jgi:hypothetical protein
MGDLNEWRRHGRSALARFGPTFGPIAHGVPSFPSYFPVLPLDRIIARPAWIVGPLAAHDSPQARLASDHLPVKAPVRLDATAVPEVVPERRRRPIARVFQSRRRGSALTEAEMPSP